MGRHIRQIPEFVKWVPSQRGEPLAMVYVETKCIQGRYLVLPTPEATSVIRGIIGRAQAELTFPIYGYAAVCDSVKLLLGVRTADELAEITKYIHGNISRELGRADRHDWAGPMFAGRPTWSLIFDPESAEKALTDVLSTATAEGFVDGPTDFMGPDCARSLCNGTEDVGMWPNRSSARGSSNPGERAYSIQLTPIPPNGFQHWDGYSKRVRSLCKRIRKKFRKRRRFSGQAPLGMGKLVRMSPHHRPEAGEERERRRKPGLFRAACAKTVADAWLTYAQFVADFRRAHASWRRGSRHYRFPAGCIGAQWLIGTRLQLSAANLPGPEP